MPRIKTRLLILSDTHGHTPSSSPLSLPTSQPALSLATTGYRAPLPAADVAIHCGDLSTHSHPSEYAATITTLRALPAPLKIVIPGNHDRALDGGFWDRPPYMHKGRHIAYPPEYRAETLRMLKDAEADGVVYMGEAQSTRTFHLQSGARLTVYANPWTPKFGHWGFQYRPEEGHDFAVPEGVDVAMTHGPPRGVLDMAGWEEHEGLPEAMRAGCAHLFTSISRARPRVHCFGHIHEAWGAYLAKWRPQTHPPSSTSASTGILPETELVAAEDTIDEEASKSIITLKELKPRTVLCPPPTDAQMARLRHFSEERGVHIDLEELRGEEDGRHTLFLNAAIQGFLEKPSQMPFVLDMMLDADDEHLTTSTAKI